MNINYKNTIFALLKAPSKIVSTHVPKNKGEHQQLLQRAIDSGCLLYYAPAILRDGKYVVQQPWELDRESVKCVKEPKPEPKPEKKQEPKKQQEKLQPKDVDFTTLLCPFCGKKTTSTPGRTLHVKSCHSDKLGEYREWLKSAGKK